MGFYCYTVISCGANSDGPTREIAKRHLLRDDLAHIAKGFLTHVADGKAYASSWKGSAITYGAVGNYVDPDFTVEQLLPFFDDLWESEGEILLDFEHAIILVNQEQSMQTDVREIVSPKHASDPECTPEKWIGKRVRSYTANWSWHQM